MQLLQVPSLSYFPNHESLTLLQAQVSDVPPNVMSAAHALVESKFSDLGAEVSELKVQSQHICYVIILCNSCYAGAAAQLHAREQERAERAGRGAPSTCIWQCFCVTGCEGSAQRHGTRGVRCSRNRSVALFLFDAVSGVKSAVAGVDQKFAYVGDVQLLQSQVADHAAALARVESSLKLEIETVVSAMTEGLQQQADLRSRAAEDTLADIQTVWERCREALSKTEAETAHSSEYLQGLLRSQIQERIEGHEGVVRDVNAALAEMANQLQKLRDEVSSQLRLSAAKTKTLAKGVKTAWGDVESVRSDCNTQLAAAAMAITEMKAKISSMENKELSGLRQGQQHTDLLLKDMERRVGESEEAIKRMHTHIAAENNALHALLSDAGVRQGQRLEDVRGALAEHMSMTLQHAIDGLLGRIASMEALQHINSSNNSALGSEVQVCDVLICFSRNVE